MNISSNIAVIFSATRSSLTRLSMMACVCGLFVSSHAQAALSWGSDLVGILRDSNGVALDSTFSMELGFFTTSFTPTADNTPLWATNWNVFDIANVDNDSFNPINGHFARDAAYVDLGVFSGKEAYLWVYDSKTAGLTTTEWFLARAASWVFPTTECCSNVTIEWSVSDLAFETATPVWGAQGLLTGGGEHINTGNYHLQTFTFIPEPSTALLAAMGTAFVLLRRRRQPISATGLNVVLVASVVVIGMASPCKAERIHWYGPTFKTNLTSKGEVIDETMVFELGLFKDNFVPTADNVSEWSTHWLAAQRANYSPNNKFFTGKFVVDQADSPFTGGKPAYVWGFRGGVEAGEWILFRKDTWIWPILAADQAAEARNPLSAREWNAAEATAIVGTIQADSEPFLMKTAKVSNAGSPKTSWDQWSKIYLKDESRDGMTEDADGDGINNLLEYVFGSLPKKANPQAAMSMKLVKDGANEFMEITIPRRSDHTAKLTLEVSSDLINWTSGGNVTTTISDTPAGWIVRDLVPHGAGNPKRFFRLKAEP